MQTLKVGLHFRYIFFTKTAKTLFFRSFLNNFIIFFIQVQIEIFIQISALTCASRSVIFVDLFVACFVPYKLRFCVLSPL